MILQLGSDAVLLLVPHGVELPVRITVKFPPYTRYSSALAPLPTSAHVHVYEGEDANANKNKLLGTLNLFNLPQVVFGSDGGIAIPQIEVTFDVDVTGQLTVTATEKSKMTMESMNATVAVQHQAPPQKEAQDVFIMSKAAVTNMIALLFLQGLLIIFMAVRDGNKQSS